ncbi:oxidoreductase [Apiospora rasikravindrae]|uniref:Oxidoreductase n=1 Tax=Apiospora rasikravindrae TaxID=990691 RepID=A0ABR1SZG6_9PEZI
MGAAVSRGEWHPPNLTAESVKAILRGSGTCCTALYRVMGAKVSYPGQQAFESSVASYWSVLERELRPSCVVTPSSKSDVSQSVFVLRIGDEVFPGQCNFAVRSGGHTPFAGSANIQSGITIDLSKMKHVDLSTDRTSVTIGPGNRWGDVYSVLDAQGLSTSGGRVASVGVGGLVTGGGISFFSPRYGYNFEVVLASGELANANATSHPSLWRALKGGSNNLGIVTSLTMRTFAQGNFWGGFLVIDIAAVEQQFAAFEALLGSPDYDPYASLIFSLFWDAPADVWATSYGMHYTQPVENPPAFRNFTALPQIYGTMRISNLTDFALEMAAANPSDHRDLFVTATYKNSAEMMAAIYRISQAVVAPLRSVPNIKL